MNRTVKEIKTLLQQVKKPPSAGKPLFYKTGPGEYGQHDQFIGVSVPVLRKLAQQYSHLSLGALKALMTSPVNEERLLALLILINRYTHAKTEIVKQQVYAFYLKHLRYVNNWNLVDTSAPAIMGAHLSSTKDKALLRQLAKSNVLWDRRIAILSTYYFIRQGEYKETLNIAKLLVQDSHDLIHKATGWMLREVGKRNVTLLKLFLEKHAPQMPRVMLRYAIEKLSVKTQQQYLPR